MPINRALSLPLYLVALLAAVSAGGLAEASSSRSTYWDLCARHVVEAERLLGLPSHLMQAISKVESGRWSRTRKAIVAWPWTVMAEGRGRYLPNRRSAIAEVRRLQARGVRNIDVGCMQINLHWHPEAFDNLQQAFDPAYNVAYAAAFLQELRGSSRTWRDAVGRYHSNTPDRMRSYRDKVLRRWQDEKREARRSRLENRKQAALRRRDGQLTGGKNPGS